MHLKIIRFDSKKLVRSLIIASLRWQAMQSQSANLMSHARIVKQKCSGVRYLRLSSLRLINTMIHAHAATEPTLTLAFN